MRFAEHVQMTFIAIATAVLIGVPLGVWCARSVPANRLLMPVINVIQTIPGLAMLAFLLPFLGIGFAPAITALILYSILPVTRNTTVGLVTLNPSCEEAAGSLGSRPLHLLCRVSLPLAAPVIVAGVRTAAVWAVGLATLAAFIGAGGLGDLINRGLALNNTALLLTGAIPAAGLAVCLDALLGRMEKLPFCRFRKIIPLIFIALVVGALIGPALKYLRNVETPAQTHADDVPGKLRIGTKNWSEQIILGEIVAQLAEEKYGMVVERKFGFGSTDLIARALSRGEIDLYPEYTGTIWSVLLKESAPDAALPAYENFLTLQDKTGSRLQARIIADLGFENTYALAIRRVTAEKLKIHSLTGLAAVSGGMTAAFNSEFIGRPDGWPALQKAYGLSFRDIHAMDAMLVYEALRTEQVDVASVFSTDGRIRHFDLTLLEDDRRVLSDYTCVLLASLRSSSLDSILDQIGLSLASRITAEKMRELNYAVDIGKRSPSDVAREFLTQEGLIPGEVRLSY